MGIIGTTSDKEFMQDSELFNAFNVALTVPKLSSPEHFKAVLKQVAGFPDTVIEDICSNLQGKALGIQKLLLVAEMAVQRSNPTTSDVFFDCLLQAGGH